MMVGALFLPESFLTLYFLGAASLLKSLATAFGPFLQALEFFLCEYRPIFL
jgi:hypothetical protein